MLLVRCFRSRVVPLSLCSVSLDPDALEKKTMLPIAKRRGKAGRPRGDTGRASDHNASLAPLLTLRHCRRDTCSPVSCTFDGFANLSGCSCEIVKSRVVQTSDVLSLHYLSKDRLMGSLPIFPSRSLSFKLSLRLSHSYSLALWDFVSTNDRRWILSLSLSHSRAFSLSLSLSLSRSPCCSLALSLSYALALLLSCSLLCRVHKRPMMDSFSLSLARSLAVSLSRFFALPLFRFLALLLCCSLALSLSHSLALLLSRSLALSLSCSLDLLLSCSFAFALRVFTTKTTQLEAVDSCW